MLEPLCNKVTGLEACNFIKKRLQHGCFPVNIAKFLRKALLIEHFGWLLLKHEIFIWNCNNLRRYWEFYIIGCKIFTFLFLKKNITNTNLYLHFKDWSILFWFYLVGSSHQRCPVKKGVLEILQNSQENICARASFLKKLQAGTGVFLWILRNFYVQVFLQDTSSGCFCKCFPSPPDKGVLPYFLNVPLFWGRADSRHIRPFKLHRPNKHFLGWREGIFWSSNTPRTPWIYKI